jgi:retron-type reverse transcriptase
MKTLFQEVRTEKNLFAAWRHVKKSALNSDKSDIRGEASEFESQHQRHLKTIATQLREERFKFDPIVGILKDQKARRAKGKPPRPIAIGTIGNRIVQRAILQVLQPRKTLDPKNPHSKAELLADARIGNIDKVNRSKFGVGGLLKPYGGVEPAIKLVLQAMENGGRYFYRTDIRAFFTKIPTAKVVEIVRNETSDEKFTDLFSKALEVHLSNSDEIAGYAELFPQNGIGVAQGSSLSALAGNLLLYDFDHQLNGLGVVAVRYIDDLIMIAKNKHDLDAARSFAEKEMQKFDFSLYKPQKGSDKAEEGVCADGFGLLGCTLQPKKCTPSSAAVKSLIANIDTRLSKSQKAIRNFIEKGQPLPVDLSTSVTLTSLGRRIFGWQKSFAFCSETAVFAQADEKIRNKITNYQIQVRRMMHKQSSMVCCEILGIPEMESLQAIDIAKRNK